MDKKKLIGITLFGIISLSLSFILWNIPMVKAQNTQTLEGEWACVSAPTPDAMGLCNQTVTILPKEGGYRANWSARPPSAWTYIGNDTRIEHTDMLPLSSDLNPQMPYNVRERVGDAQFRHTFSFTLVGDGNSAEFAEEGVSVSWDDSGDYNTVPTKDVWALNRVSGPTQSSRPVPVGSPVAQVESRGEYYFLTKDGRKLTGDEANKVPLEEGAKVVTGNDGHVRMTLPDNTTFTVGPNTDLVIDKFVYDSDKTPGQIMATMTKGVFRWVTGKTTQHDPSQMKITLPVVAVGIRGTDFEATVAPDGSGSVVLNFGQLEITEKKTGFTFIMNAGEKVTFGADGSVSRPMKIN